MQLFLEDKRIILRLLEDTYYSQNNLPEPTYGTANISHMAP